MKVIIIGRVGTSDYEKHIINQFDDVKVEVRKPIYEDKEVLKDVEKEVDGQIIVTQEIEIQQVLIGEGIYYTLPDGSIPDEIESWQSRPDPIAPDGWVLLKEERPNGDYKVSAKGNWIKDDSIQIAANQAIKDGLLSDAVNQISLLQDAIDFDMQEDGDEDRLKAWKIYRISLTRIDVSSDEIIWPQNPSDF